MRQTELDKNQWEIQLDADSTIVKILCNTQPVRWICHELEIEQHPSALPASQHFAKLRVQLTDATFAKTPPTFSIDQLILPETQCKQLATTDGQIHLLIRLVISEPEFIPLPLGKQNLRFTTIRL